MTPSRPYLLRALYDWISDNGLTPHIVVDATVPGVEVPAFAVRDGKVVLNIALRAVDQLDLGNERLSFLARFGGVSHAVSIPVAAVTAIYARENGVGMAFAAERGETAPDGPAVASGDEDPPGGEGGGPRRGHLRVIK
ncbi:MAG: ClpXP protease specificity-enhancing factor [Xanthomonadales bacterium]|nr:ClpXP protease specificity-enhancing factor [Xanthomonadales bacterium]